MHSDGPPYMVQKRPYREPGEWYWIIVDRRNGLSTMRRYPTESSANVVRDQLNGGPPDVAV